MESQYHKMIAPQLRAELRRRDCVSTGPKSKLLDRLQAVTQEAAKAKASFFALRAPPRAAEAATNVDAEEDLAVAPAAASKQDDVLKGEGVEQHEASSMQEDVLKEEGVEQHEATEEGVERHEATEQQDVPKGEGAEQQQEYVPKKGGAEQQAEIEEDVPKGEGTEQQQGHVPKKGGAEQPAGADPQADLDVAMAPTVAEQAQQVAEQAQQAAEQAQQAAEQQPQPTKQRRLWEGTRAAKKALSSSRRLLKRKSSEKSSEALDLNGLSSDDGADDGENVGVVDVDKELSELNR